MFLFLLQKPYHHFFTLATFVFELEAVLITSPFIESFLDVFAVPHTNFKLFADR